MDLLSAELDPETRTSRAEGPPPKSRLSEYPRAGHVLLHLSDTHLVAGAEGLWGGVDSDAHLAAALDDLEGSGLRPDAIIFTGDLADTGEPEAYGKLRSMVEPVAGRMGAELLWLMGNHDDRAQFRTRMLDQLPTYDPIDTVTEFNGLRVIGLDTSVPGYHHGQVTDQQLAWLTETLATPAEHGTILAMHHPPIPSVLDLAVSVELYDQHLLADVVRGTDVRAIVAGHLHYSSSATFAGIPVSVASATCYTQDLTVPVGGTRPRDGAQAYNLIHVYPDTVVHSVVPVGRGRTMSFTTAAESAALLAESGIRIRE